MLKKSHRLLVDQLGYHIAEDCADSVETLISLTDVLQAHVVKQNLLDNEDGNSFAELRASLHDTEAKRDDLRGEEEVDDLGRVILNQSTNDTERGQTEVLEGPRFRCSVEERVEEERDVC
jgi:hypothetical protein